MAFSLPGWMSSSC